MRSKKISRRVWRFLASYTRSAKVGCSINSLSVRHRAAPTILCHNQTGFVQSFP